MNAINRAGAPDSRAISELLNSPSHPGGTGQQRNDWAVAFGNVDDTRVKRDASAPRTASDATSDSQTPEGKTPLSGNGLGVECIDAESSENEPATMVQIKA